MAASAVELYYNDQRVKLSWNTDQTGTYASFNLYWSALPTMVGEVAIQRYIPNADSDFLGKNKVFFEFDRANIGLLTSNEFYVRIKGVNRLGVEDVANPSPTRYIPKLTDNREEFNAAQIYGYDYVKNIWKKLSVADDGSLDISSGGGVTGMAVYEPNPLFLNKSTVQLFNTQTLSGAWQSSSSISTAGFGQAVVYVTYARSAGDGTFKMKFEFSHNNSLWYVSTYDSLVGSDVTSSDRIYDHTAAFTQRLAIPLADNYMRMGIYADGGGLVYGQVTAYLTLGWN